MDDQKLYWHFLPDNGHLTHDLSHVKAEVGQTVTYDGMPYICKQGLHASERALDALFLAPGAIACLVTLGGLTSTADAYRFYTDKIAAQSRTIVAMADATDALHEFALWCAERAMALLPNPDVRLTHALDMKRRWLRGEVQVDAVITAAFNAYSIVDERGSDDVDREVARTVHCAAETEGPTEAASGASCYAASALELSGKAQGNEEVVAHNDKLDALLREALGVSEPADALSS